MDFQNVNLLNIRSNYITGNLLPISPRDSQFSITWKLFAVLMWLVQIAEVSGLIAGFAFVSKEKVLNDCTLSFVLTIEVFFVTGQIQAHGKQLGQLIEKMNNILQIEDEMMRNIVTKTLKPMDTPLRYYSVAGSLCVSVWFLLQFLLVFEKDVFFYEDFRMPVAFSKQPFSIRTFVLVSILILIGNVHIFLKKCGLYIYMIHLVLMMTAQYRYTAKRLATIFREADKRCKKLGEVSYEENQWAENAIKELCKHHTTIVG